MRRLGRLLLGLWVSVTLSGVPLGHGCPAAGMTVGGEPTATASAVQEAAPHGDHGGHPAGHGAEAAVASDAHASHGPDAGGHATECECVGDCGGVTVVSLPPLTVSIEATFRLQAPASLRVATPEVSVAPTLGLPFATAPPAVSTT